MRQSSTSRVQCYRLTLQASNEDSDYIGRCVVHPMLMYECAERRCASGARNIRSIWLISPASKSARRECLSLSSLSRLRQRHGDRFHSNQTSVSTRQQLFCVFPTALGLYGDLAKSRLLSITLVSSYVMRARRKSCYVQNCCPAGFARPRYQVRDTA